jgi:hypothetical protein
VSGQMMAMQAGIVVALCGSAWAEQPVVAMQACLGQLCPVDARRCRQCRQGGDGQVCTELGASGRIRRVLYWRGQEWPCPGRDGRQGVDRMAGRRRARQELLVRSRPGT